MADLRPLLVVACVCLLAACLPAAAPLPSGPPPATASPSPSPFLPVANTPLPVDSGPAGSPAPSQAASPSPTASLMPEATPEPTAIPTPTATTLPTGLDLDPAAWKDWPILPLVPARAREIYQFGQALGIDAHAFSVFGDCQSEPPFFLGPYESDPDLRAALTPDLQETVAWFAGSFDSDAPTIRGGTTTGALLWALWHQNKYGCTTFETPLQCELRLHRPAFVIVHVGSHYEDRNEQYMRLILDQLIAAGVVPILASKADNREVDEHVNAQYAGLAAEYDLPFWNFWSAVRDLPNRGLYTHPGWEFQGDLYLTDEAAAIHRLTALQTLDLVRRAVAGP